MMRMGFHKWNMKLSDDDIEFLISISPVVILIVAIIVMEVLDKLFDK